MNEIKLIFPVFYGHRRDNRGRTFFQIWRNLWTPIEIEMTMEEISQLLFS